jgi:hypothetical protein
VIAPPPIRPPKGAAAEKFAGAEARNAGHAQALAEVASELGCPLFNAGRVVSASGVDGVHLDADQHLILAHALAMEAAALLDKAADAGH